MTPRAAAWFMYSEFTAGTPESEEVFESPASGPGPTQDQPNLKLDGVSVGDVCQFKVFLDSNIIQAGANAADRAKGSFNATRRGQKSFRFTTKGPGNYYNVADDYSTTVSWHLTIYWHLE